MLAAQHVFDTPELLENIISQLPMPAIHRVKLVSKSIKALIDVSPACQGALFLRARHGTPYAAYSPSDAVNTPHQPLALLAPGTAIGNLVFNGLTASENFYQPPKLRQIGRTALFLMVRQALNDAERRNVDGSWRAALSTGPDNNGWPILGLLLTAPADSPIKSGKILQQL